VYGGLGVSRWNVTSRPGVRSESHDDVI